MASKTTFDFHKVSESADVEVYQSMQKYATKEAVTESGATIPAPIKYGPQTLKVVDTSTLGEALAQFDGYDINSIAISKDSGIMVKVTRTGPYEPSEPNVERLKPKKVKGGDA